MDHVKEEDFVRGHRLHRPVVKDSGKEIKVDQYAKCVANCTSFHKLEHGDVNKDTNNCIKIYCDNVTDSNNNNNTNNTDNTNSTNANGTNGTENATNTRLNCTT